MWVYIQCALDKEHVDDDNDHHMIKNIHIYVYIYKSMYQAQKLDCANCLAIGFVCVLKILVNTDKEKKKLKFL